MIRVESYKLRDDLMMECKAIRRLMENAFSSSLWQTFIYSSSPHSLLTTLHTTQVPLLHQHILSATASSGHQECK